MASKLDDPAANDPRVNFVQSAVYNLCALKDGQIDEAHTYGFDSIEDFLDNLNCLRLQATVTKDENNAWNLEFSTEDRPKRAREGRALCGVDFVKLRAEPLTEANMTTNVLVSSQGGANEGGGADSPLRNLYATFHSLYAPALLGPNSEHAAKLDPQLRELLAKLDAQLGCAVRGAGGGHQDDDDETGYAGILSVEDEYEYWSNQASVNRRGPGGKFRDCLEAIANKFSTLNESKSSEVFDLLEDTQNVLDDIWKADLDSDVQYPEARMVHLFGVIAGSLGQYVQSSLSKLDVWHGPFSRVRSALLQAVRVCDKWTATTRDLTGKFWPGSDEHPWRGGTYADEYLIRLGQRIEQVGRLRSMHEELLKLISPSDRKQLDVDGMFRPFEGKRPLHYSAYTDPQWHKAVKMYEEKLVPVEHLISSNLRKQIQSMADKPQQLLREFQRYRQLLRRPNIGQVLVAERETLLARLHAHMEQLDEDFEYRSSSAATSSSDRRSRGGGAAGPPLGKTTSVAVNNVVWGKQLRNKVKYIIRAASNLLSDIQPAFQDFKERAEGVHDKLEKWVKDQVKEWTGTVKDQLENQELSVQVSGNLMEIDSVSGNMIVNYSESLVALLRDTRQLSGLGFAIPRDIQRAAAEGEKYFRFGVQLKKVANFINTMDSQIIPSQKPMLLKTLIEFDECVKGTRSSSGKGGSTVTWSDPGECERYVGQLQKAAEQLSLENRRLRKAHLRMVGETVALMGTDILRQKDRWKGRWKSLQDMAKTAAAVYTPDRLTKWHLHWDHQVYKALEATYRFGLESLNEHLPDIKCELVFSQRKLMFRPSVEELRASYYRQMSKFISIPNNFSGFGNNDVYAKMADLNSKSLIQVYVKAENLFTRLSALQKSLESWVLLGSVPDIFEYVETNVTEVAQWEVNFKMLKSRRQMLDKMKDSHRIDCIAVSATPFKAAVEGHLQSFGDALFVSLRKSILTSLGAVETFLSESMSFLGVLPQTIEEIGNAKKEWQRIVNERDDMRAATKRCTEQKQLLVSQSGSAGNIDTAEVTGRLAHLPSEWENLDIAIEAFSDILEEAKAKMKDEIERQIMELNQEIDKFSKRWDALKPKEMKEWDRPSINRVFDQLKDWRSNFDELKGRTTQHAENCEQFQMPPPKYTGLEDLEMDIDRTESAWNMLNEYLEGLDTMGKQSWIVFRGNLYDLQDFAKAWMEKIKKRSAAGERGIIDEYMSEQLEQFKKAIPALKFMRGEPYKEEHWAELFNRLKMPKGISIQTLTFQHFLDSIHLVAKNGKYAKDMTARAQGEVTIREALLEIKAWAAAAEVKMMGHEELGRETPLICEWKDLFTSLGDNQSLLQSLKDSPYYKPFSDTGSTYEQKFALLDEVLHAINSIQRKWVYLEPIFGRGALPQEQGRFKRVDEEFRDILIRLNEDKIIFSLADDSLYPRIGENVAQMLSQLERCQKALADFLEEKRSTMPRFYFIGDDDLLEILGQAQNPTVIQAHLKKLFQGVYKVEFSPDNKHVKALVSSGNEIVQLENPVQITDKVEIWLGDLSKEMQMSLRAILVRCARENLDKIGELLPKYPGQVLLVAAQVGFSTDVENALRSGTLGKLVDRYKERLRIYTALDLSTEKLLQSKIKNLVLELIHMIDVAELLRENGVTSVGAWLWQKQLRWYIPSGGTQCVVRMVNAEFLYTYEYQGNTGKLVHTPLTDKCYLTMTQGMRMGFGGNPYGPAGTGKTESVKALGGCLGRQVLVFNCDEGIDFESMGRIFTGLVKCGAWGCFDEFNRLKEDQLSAVSQQIQVIQSAIKLKDPTLSLLGKTIDVDHNAGIFVTMNPAGKKYGGRSKLPENLKNLFRPVAMSKPDNDIIAEAMLVSEGFSAAKDIAHKLCELYGLSEKLLSVKQHYDWGLRAMKAVLNTAGKLLQRAKTEQGSRLSVQIETELLIKSVRVNTLSKLTFADAIGFLGLIKDVFPGCSSEDIRYAKLEAAMKEVMTNKPYNLKFDEGQVRKMIQLKESLEQRMGCVIVGPSGCGKTSLWRILRDSLQKVGETVKIYVMNPKSMPRERLLGHMDMDTREWFDGVLTDAARKVVKEPLTTRSWIVCDGDVDPEWIESLNTVLDDNHLLTMPNGERISFGSNVNFLFETHNLVFASPATISRNGMIYLSDEDVDVRRLVFSWLNNLPEKQQLSIGTWVQDFFYKALEWVLQDGMSMMVVETTMVGIVTTGLSHLGDATSVQEFICGLIRGLGGNLGYEERGRFAKDVFSWAGERLPDLGSPLDVYADGSLLGAYSSETSMEGEIGRNAVLRTVSVQRNMDIIKGWVERMEPFILVGPEGAGKNMLLMHVLSQQRSTTVTTLHCNAQTTAENVIQRVKQACVEQHSNNGRVLRPRSGDRLVLYLKDINLPKPDKYNTCMLIAFLQQLITFNGFYNEALEFVSLERIHIVCSMNPATTVGRHPLSTRFTAIVHIAYIDYPSREELVTVYASMIEKSFETKELAEPRFKTPKDAKKIADTMVELYFQVKSRFGVDDHRHYLFTPRHLTAWVIGLGRYDLASEDLLDVLSYEAQRLFRDRLVDEDSAGRFDGMLNSLIKSRWSKSPDIKNQYFSCLMGASRVGGGGKVSEGKSGEGDDEGGSARAPDPMLLRVNNSDFEQIVKDGLELYEREERELNILLFAEVLDNIARVDRTLSKKSGSLLLVGRSGVGRRTATSLVAHMHGMQFHTLDITNDFGKKGLHTQLKAVLQIAGVENEPCVFYVEDHHIANLSDVLETVNSLLSSGEVPGLYTHEELEPLLSPLKELMLQDGSFRTAYDFFQFRIQQNLHIVLGMDNVNPQFAVLCEANPALFTRCEIIWMGEWTKGSMWELPPLLLPTKFGEESELNGGKGDGGDLLRTCANEIHKSTSDWKSTPYDFVVFLKTFEHLYGKKHDGLRTEINHLKSGLSKLVEAAETVDKLSDEAREQQKQLKHKQDTADKAMDKITETLESASDRRREVEVLRADMVVEQKNTESKKADIEVELSDVKPILEEAKAAVGEIRSDNLNEIRSLKMPPEAIHDVLSAVLMLLGIDDTSWLSMKRFLGQRGVKEEILNYDAHSLSPDLRKKVMKLLKSKGSSFDDKVIYRVSVAAAPLAKWVKANIRYSLVLEKINPLERELREANEVLKRSEDRLSECQNELNSIDDKVKELKNVFKEKTREAEVLKQHLEKTMLTLEKANNLLDKLSGEKQRWDDQVDELERIADTLPLRMLIAAGFNTYLAKKPEDVRETMLKKWTELCNVDPKSFDYRRTLSSESEQLVWKASGLPGDALSMENAIVIVNESQRVPFIIDPAMTATNWLKQHLANPDFSKRPLEILNRADPRFTLQVELAVRFGKVLFINEVDSVDPMLYPLIRRDLKHQGPRFVVQVGDKTVDFDENFRLYISTRNPEPWIPPDAASLITEVNFTVTRSGLEGQLLGVTIEHEQPELEAKKSKLLAEEESYKVELASLEKNLLETLAESEGNLLENTELIDQLTKTKVTAADVKERMAESARASETVDEQREVFRPFARDGSKMFFAIRTLQSCNHMYQFSLSAFLSLFRGTLKEPMDVKGDGESALKGRVSKLTPVLEKRVLYFVGRSLFKADRLMWGLHLVRSMYPHMYGENEWELFTGDIVSGIDGDNVEGKSGGGASRNFPQWASSSRCAAFALLETTFPRFVSGLNLSDTSLWGRWARSPECEKEFPGKLGRNKLTPFQKVLLTQALRPDRLQSQMQHFVCEILDVSSLAPPPTSLQRFFAAESSAAVPILLVTSPGADPSKELEDLAGSTVGRDHYFEVAMGGGQQNRATKYLHDCAKSGEWLCLKNLHLVTAWLPILEKEISTLKPAEGFRLWLTTEAHPNFPPILLQVSVKLTFESPPGLKKNLQRTYESWDDEFIAKGSPERAQLLYVLAYFHALVQERRTYMPQGWVKFYEFSLGDLRAGTNIIDMIGSGSIGEGSKAIDWETVIGLMENAIYGGRVDNNYDYKVLNVYLRQYFNPDVLRGGHGKLADRGFSMPAPTTAKASYVSLIDGLPEEDIPSFFGLPMNVERSVQRAQSALVVSQLKSLSLSSGSRGGKFDREHWRSILGPICSLWDKLVKSSSRVMEKPDMKKSGGGGAMATASDIEPIKQFISNESQFAFTLISIVDTAIRNLNRVLWESGLLTPEIQTNAVALLSGCVPRAWENMWEGPEKPSAWLRSLVMKKVSLSKWNKKFGASGSVAGEELDLSELFNPGTFLMAVRQQTSREGKMNMDELGLRSSFGTDLDGAVMPVKLVGMMLQGAAFNNGRLSEADADAPELIPVPQCTLAFDRVSSDSGNARRSRGNVNIPVYFSTSRERLLTDVEVPVSGDPEDWVVGGVALFLSE